MSFLMVSVICALIAGYLTREAMVEHNFMSYFVAGWAWFGAIGGLIAWTM